MTSTRQRRFAPTAPIDPESLPFEELPELDGFKPGDIVTHKGEGGAFRIVALKRHRRNGSIHAEVWGGLRMQFALHAFGLATLKHATKNVAKTFDRNNHEIKTLPEWPYTAPKDAA